jgi:hypothetical protein
MAKAEAFRVGDKVYLDTIASSLVPGIVVGHKRTQLEVEVTGSPRSWHGQNAGGYKKGEVIESAASGVVMREWVRRRRHQTLVFEPANFSASTPRKRVR